MKKILFVAAATMLGLSSCSDNEIFNSVEKSKTPITVNVYQQNQTRAVTETTLTTLQSGFKFVAVSATNPTSSFIEETTVSMQGGKWDYGTTAYWPTNTSEAVKFYGVYPTSGTIDPANDKVTVTVNGTTDAVVSYKSQSQTTDGSVSLSFSHILGQVLIYAMGDNGDFNYTITGLTLNTDDVIDYTCASKATTAATTSTKKDFAFLATGSAISASYSSDGVFTSLNGTGNANVLALPALPVTLTIYYTVASKTTGGGSDSLIKKATFTPQAGKLNRINLTLPSSRTAMTFTVDPIDGWGAETNTPATWNAN